MQKKGLLPKAIGVLTKADELKRPEELRAWIKGGNIVDEDDGSVRTAAALGQVEIAKGWTATMLKMPKRMVKAADGTMANYYINAQLERLEQQKVNEKQFFGGAGANPVMRELYDQGRAGTGALAAKLNYEYYEYCRTDWLEATLTRLFRYELQLKSDRALLGVTDSEDKDKLAAEEVESTLRDGAEALTQRFVSEVLDGEGKIFPIAREAVTEIDTSENEVNCNEINSELGKLQSLLKEHIAIAVEAVETFYADELKKMLDAPIRVSVSSLNEVDETDNVPAPPAPGALAGRFWKEAGAATKLVRSLFGTAMKLPTEAVEVHKKVIAQPIIQLGAYPGYTTAVAAVVRAECVIAKTNIEAAVASVVEQVGANNSLYIRVQPLYPLLDKARITMRATGSKHHHAYDIINALQVAFLRHLPSPEQLKEGVRTATGLKLSEFVEDTQTAEKRRELDERLARVEFSMVALVRALDVDPEDPVKRLDAAWLDELKKRALNE